jgi:hypothetical protein
MRAQRRGINGQLLQTTLAPGPNGLPNGRIENDRRSSLLISKNKDVDEVAVKA